jgi:type IV pilus assembly protein PilB
MKLDDKTIKSALLKGNYITDTDVKEAEEFLKTHRLTLVEYLIQKNFITRDLLGQAVAEWYKIPYADFSVATPKVEQVEKIPEDVAKKNRVVVFSEDKTKIVVATDNPADENLSAELKKVFPNKKIQLAYAASEGIDACFVLYQKPLETRFSKIIENQGRVAPELLEEIFDDALVYRASDIHFEPQKTVVVVRFRVDGVLHEAGKIPREYYENILNRIKVRSGLRIDEHFSAQDGSLQHEKDGTFVDMRVSIVPTIEGEKVVLRVLATYVQGFTLSDLGLTNAHEQMLEKLAQKPFGMILVVGPTGSGKTTTLYALIKLVNNPNVNITTIEDPVEYKVVGINQIQVNTLTGLTFAKGLRSIVRQDPDIILVGEIRDNETAEIAVNAALTGHLLYSTFHANDAATAIPRLLDMGIEPFLLSSTLEAVIAQRLVRKICDRCRFSVVKKPSDFDTTALKSVARFFPEKTVTLYQGKGCDACGNTGYKGRTAIFEFILISLDMQNVMLKSPSTKDIWEQARKEGSRSFFEDGLDKVRSGVTTLEELLRVAEPPEQVSTEQAKVSAPQLAPIKKIYVAKKTTKK